MSGAARRAEFFALEAREYLAELEPLTLARDVPDAERLVRGARALRGASLMAGLGTFARAAAGLEAMARQVRDNALAWEPDARTAWREGLETLKTLVTRATSWEASDDRMALGLADRLDRVAGGQSLANPVSATPALTPGVRAFIARESALIAGSLEQAARALAPLPPPAALAAVLERMQSLRGLHASAELSPLPELLDAMEVATRTLLADVPPPPDVGAVFADAAHALAAMARSVAETGRVAPLAEVDRLAARLLESYAVERDVVPIEALAPDGMEAIVRRGTLPTAGSEGAPVPVELISVGDHLLLTADALSQVPTTAIRDLRLFVLHRTLATMPPRGGTGRFLSPLVEAITSAIGDGIAVREPEAFVKMLRECGRFLVDSGGQADGPARARERDQLAARLITVELGGTERVVSITSLAYAEAPAADDGSDEPVVPIADLGFEETIADAVVDEEIDVVSIGSLAPVEVEEELDVVSIASLAPEEDDDVEEIVSIASLAPDEPAPPVIPALAEGEPGVLELAYRRDTELALGATDDSPSLEGLIAMQILPVESLSYRGESAWQRIDEVRSELYQLLEAPDVSLDQLRPCLSELLDLVPLARASH